MKYLLDTCVISELIKPEPHSHVIDWLNAQNEEGIAKLPASKRKQNLQNWLDNDLQQRFNARIININSEIAECWGNMQGEAEQKGKKMSVIDSLIASI